MNKLSNLVPFSNNDGQFVIPYFFHVIVVIINIKYKYDAIESHVECKNKTFFSRIIYMCIK